MGYNFVRDVIERNDKRKTAVIMSDENLSSKNETYGTLLKESYKLSNFMRQLRLKAGNRILIMMENSLDLYHVVTASIAAGMVYAPTAPILPDDQIKYRVEQLKAKAIFVDAGTHQKAEQFGDIVVNMSDEGTRVEISKMDDTFNDFETEIDGEHAVFFTSGTEGMPKMVLHTNRYPEGHRTTVKWLDLNRDDVHWNISSPGWAKWGWSSYYSPFIAGSAVFGMSYRRFDPERALDAMSKFQITSVCAPPTVWRMFLQHDVGSRALYLKKAASAGEPLNPEVIERFEKYTGVKIKDGYGQTESTLMVGNLTGMKVKPGSMGKSLEPYDIRIVDENGNELGVNRTGFIAVKAEKRPEGLFSAYINDKKLTHDRFKNGYYYTGDTGYRDEDGYIWFVSRSDDVIKASDYRIGPFEVESALLRHPAVVESAVVGSPDDIRGDIVKAYVVLKKGYEPSYELARELSMLVRNTIGPHARPKRIEFVEDLPKTISGKIIRKQLRQMEIDRYMKMKNGINLNTSNKEFNIERIE
ncbi:AMP-binding protein [Thermoplasma volcanium]|nr:AMP-binding protein [Thermoplasma volcanium]